MGWWMAAVYDRFMASAEAGSFGEWRAELVGDLTGDVLDVGAGTGANLPYYPAGLTRLVLAEPDPHMRRRIPERSGGLPVELCDSPIGALPFKDESFDVVVCTLVLCSVPDVATALSELRRVLRPGGRLRFLEHVAAEDDPALLARQRRWDPVWRRVAGGCRLTRPTGRSLVEAGFEMETSVRARATPALAVVAPTIRGTARVAGATDRR